MQQNSNTSKIHYLLEAKTVARDKFVLLTARYIHSLIVSSPGTGRRGESSGPHEEAAGCTRSGDKQEQSETVRAGSRVHNISVVGLEGKVASD